MAAIKGDNWVRNFDVTNPTRHENGFTVYKVTSVVFPKSAPEATTKVVVWKRFNDFKRLHKSLKQYHKQWNISEQLPMICKGKFFKRFDEVLINDRIHFALELLNYIGRHQCLFTSDAFLQFFNDSYQVCEPSNECRETFADESRLEKNHTFNFDRNSHCLNVDSTDEENDLTSGSPGSNTSFDSAYSIYAAREKDSVANLHPSNRMTCKEDDPLALPSQEEKVFSLGSTHVWSSPDFSPTCSSLQEDGPLPQGHISKPGEDDHPLEAVARGRKCEAESCLSLYRCSGMSCLVERTDGFVGSERGKAVGKKSNRYLDRGTRMIGVHVKLEKNVGPCVYRGAEELTAYKVKSIIDSKVMAVMKATDEEWSVMKVLEKSPCPSNKTTIIPCRVPFMVKLYRYFENENSVFLLLQYAKGGKLWDRLRDFCELEGTNERICRTSEFLPYRSHSSFACRKEDSDFDKFCRKSSGQVKEEINGRTGIGTMPFSDFEEIETDDEYVKVSLKEDMGDLEVINIVKNSQKLLNSVNKTLETSEKLTSNLSKNLMDIEIIFESNCRPITKNLSKCLDLSSAHTTEHVRSRSANPRLQLDKCFSYQDLSDTKSRTAPTSIDRKGDSATSLTTNFIPRVPESLVRNWAAEILVALETLHRHNIVYRDLRPANVLLDDSGNILLTFQALWSGVDSLLSEEAVSNFYAAPETSSVFPITPAVDWWSFGALLFELLTGKTLSSCYPEGIWSHTTLSFPEFVSPEACSLLAELLKYEAGERLGSGANGAEDIKCHPFFNLVDWQLIYDVY